MAGLIDEVEQKAAHAARWVTSLADDGCIIRKNRSHRVQFRDHDQLREALTAGGLALNVDADHSNPLNVQVGIQITDTLKTLTVSGDPIGVSRGHAEVSYDDGAFLGVLFQKVGRTVRSSRQGQTIINPGDLVIWHGRHSLRFDMPEYFQKVCLLAPIETFERILPDAESYAGLHLQEHLNVARLLGACFSTLANRVLTNDTEPPNAALEVALDLLGAALTRHRESNEIGFSFRLQCLQKYTTFPPVIFIWYSANAERLSVPGSGRAAWPDVERNLRSRGATVRLRKYRWVGASTMWPTSVALLSRPMEFRL